MLFGKPPWPAVNQNFDFKKGIQVTWTKYLNIQFDFLFKLNFC